MTAEAARQHPGLRHAARTSTSRRLCWLAWSVLLSILAFSPAAAQNGSATGGEGGYLGQPMRLVLPTENDALYRGEGPDFYQYTDRRIKPGFALPWEGGRYGFVRTGRETRHGVIYTRFHEGMDIKPVRRSSRREPLDDVHTMDDGIVRYVNRGAGRSNYGLYVVVEHWWSGSPFYSLYAHLKSVDVAAGQEVERGQKIGRMGYTGVGINRRRAHVHVEINLLINERAFQSWYDDYFEEENYHGIYNGLNLSGMDVADLYLSLREDSSLDIREFVSREPAFYSVTIPNEGRLNILWRYPWLISGEDALSYAGVSGAASHASWVIFLTRSGRPARVERSDRIVEGPEIAVLQETAVPYAYLTNGLLTGSGNSYGLSRIGRRHLDLLTRITPVRRK